ncbi:MAG TPA: hypothetical protein PL048_21730 [Leptospiraceae bacterium]|nr:hypothetical protein [Leptospiraceae bacterium]HMY65289.1 hypothetical protein [Leptospiraceae bacterium]HMZ61409.1 hypothetical protein [Leptospiraceae bacterium]HNF16460.1 hypothetical protein [Leptospiraceae bacterium]HNF23257.1 hypothetical protein [Leptospiraceae bacterium]
MIVFHISKELQKRYQTSIDVGMEISDDETGFPFENWYVRRVIVSRSEFTLFLEKERNIIVWAKGVRSENIEEVFKERFLNTVLRAGIPYRKAADLRIAEQKCVFRKASERVWRKVSDEVIDFSESWLELSERYIPSYRDGMIYRPNKGHFGAPKYKWPEHELRKFFGLKPLDRSKFD